MSSIIRHFEWKLSLSLFNGGCLVTLVIKYKLDEVNTKLKVNEDYEGCKTLQAPLLLLPLENMTTLYS